MLQGSMHCFCWLEMSSQVFSWWFPATLCHFHFVISAFVSSHSSFCVTLNYLELVCLSPTYPEHSWTHSPTWNFDIWQLAPLFHHSQCEEVSSYVQPCSLSLSSIRFSRFCTSLSQQRPSPATGSQRPPRISTLGARKSWKKEPMMLLSRNKKILYQTQPLIGLLYCNFAL